MLLSYLCLLLFSFLFSVSSSSTLHYKQYHTPSSHLWIWSTEPKAPNTTSIESLHSSLIRYRTHRLRITILSSRETIRENLRINYSMMSTTAKILVSLAWAYVCLGVIAPMILREAYQIRLEAINEYGKYMKSIQLK